MVSTILREVVTWLKEAGGSQGFEISWVNTQAPALLYFLSRVGASILHVCKRSRGELLVRAQGTNSRGQ